MKNLTLTAAPRYPGKYVTKITRNMSMRQIKLFKHLVLSTVFILLLSCSVWLLFKLMVITQAHPQLVNLSALQVLCWAYSYTFIGLGLGLIIILVATIFGWLQLFLLLNGSIDPHMEQSGFLQVFEVLFSSIFEK